MRSSVLEGNVYLGPKMHTCPDQLNLSSCNVSFIIDIMRFMSWNYDTLHKILSNRHITFRELVTLTFTNVSVFKKNIILTNNITS